MTTLSDGKMEYYVAGAPRSNHTGQVVVYTLTSRGQPTVVDSQRGEQVRDGSLVFPIRSSYGPEVWVWSFMGH